MYERKYLAELDFDYSDEEVKGLSSMDNYCNTPKLYNIGRLAAGRQMKSEHFPEHFSLQYSTGQRIKRFTQNKDLLERNLPGINLMADEKVDKGIYYKVLFF